MATLWDKTLPDDSPSSSFQKALHMVLVPGSIDRLSWPVKSVHSSLRSSKIDAENLHLFTSGIDILRVSGFETAHFWGALRVALVTAIFSKTSVYWSSPSNKSVYHGWQRNGILHHPCDWLSQKCKGLSQNRPSMKNGRPSSSVRGTPIWVIQHNMPPLTYQTLRSLLDPTVKYCTIGPFL